MPFTGALYFSITTVVLRDYIVVAEYQSNSWTSTQIH